MNDLPDARQLRLAVAKAAQRPTFMAHLIVRYQELNGLDDDELAELLGCDVEDLAKLALCGRPDASGGNFQRDVRDIAEHTGVRLLQLAQLVREVDSVSALQQAGSGAGAQEEGLLMAARDRIQEHSPEEEMADDEGNGEADPEV